MEAPPVQYVITHDGYNIAYAVSGSGPALVMLPQIFSHIQLYWSQETFVLPWLEGLSQRFRFVQYDGRGQGMSSRGLTQYSLDDAIIDLAAVVDRARLDRFALLAFGNLIHVAVPYSAAHPERVQALVLVTPHVEGPTVPLTLTLELAKRDLDSALQFQVSVPGIQDPSASVRRLRQTVNQDDYVRIVEAYGSSNIRGLLPSLRAPTLVMHPRDYRIISADEAMAVAAAIPNARMVAIDGRNQMGDAAQGLQAIEAFMNEQGAEGPAPAAQPPSDLSSREVEVLRLIAAGKSNAQIAEELVISPNTVIRHVSNIFAKIGAANRTEAAGYATRNGIA